MNNKGWEMADMLWILAALGIALLVVGILYVQNFKDLGSSDNTGKINDENIEVTSPTQAKEEKEEEKEKEIHEETSKDSNLNYQETEELLRSAAMDYVKKFYNDQSVNEVVIKASDLEKEALISGIYDYHEPTKECKGYVIYRKEGNTYNAYLKCDGNYVTAGYNENYGS